MLHGEGLVLRPISYGQNPFMLTELCIGSIHPLRGEHGYEFVLIVFYLKDESFHVIPPPIRVIGRENVILEFQGHLALVGTTGEDHNLHFWILEDIEGQPWSWSWNHIVITVPRDSIGRTCRYPAGRESLPYW